MQEKKSAICTDHRRFGDNFYIEASLGYLKAGTRFLKRISVRIFKNSKCLQRSNLYLIFSPQKAAKFFLPSTFIDSVAV
jgi:hypothetical protein